MPVVFFRMQRLLIFYLIGRLSAAKHSRMEEPHPFGRGLHYCAFYGSIKDGANEHDPNEHDPNDESRPIENGTYEYASILSTTYGYARHQKSLKRDNPK